MKRRVLLVEPDSDNRQSLCYLFEARGYDVNVAATAKRGIDMAATHRPDVVLLELGLPDMDAQQAVTAMKGGSSQPFVIAYTGFHRREAEARAAGCDAFILKPSLDLLLAVVEALDPRIAVAGGTLH